MTAIPNFRRSASLSLRTYGSRTDAYRVFKGMLDKGNPPEDWKALLAAASAKAAVERLEEAKPA